jgi:GntR family transcriptional regulator
VTTSTDSIQGRLRADQRPLYIQVSDALRQLVQSGHYAPGERLPSEIELSQRLGISRPTLREAMRMLEEEGIIVRRHGVGTFLAASRPVIEGGLEVLESIDRMAERRGLHTQMVESTVVERPATARELQGLAMADASPLDAVGTGSAALAPIGVTVVTRVITAGNERVAYLTDVSPQAYLREAELAPAGDENFRGSVLDLFLHRGWPALAYSRTDLVAEAADAELARRLHVQRGAPLLRLDAQLYAQDGRVVDYSTSYFVPGYFRLHVVRRIG